MDDKMPKMQYGPVAALIVHAHTGKPHKYYVETHPIVNGQLQEGKPLSRAGIRKLIQAYYRETAQSKFAFLPGNLLACADDMLMWWTPPRKRTLFFTDDLNIPDGTAQLPGLVFLVENRTLHLWAVKAKRRPTEKTPLFKAPFHNTSDYVCMGNARVPKSGPDPAATMAAWETAFFSSRFSHLLGSGQVAKKVNLGLLWKKLIQTGDAFPNDVLVPASEKTVGRAIERYKQ